ncbi:MAG: hypothetical protein AAGI03_00745 [Pseudomonadota bacterium]
MSVRVATLSDIHHVVDLGERFVSAWGVNGFHRPDAMVFVEHLITEGRVFVTDGSVLAASVTPVPFNTVEMVAVEHFWWSEDSLGLRLVPVFEEWAFTVADHIVFSTIDLDDRVGPFLERRGYRVRERCWTKRVGG